MEEVVASGFWLTTCADGERLCTRLDGSKVPVKRALISMASDPATSQVHAHQLCTSRYMHCTCTCRFDEPWMHACTCT